MPLSESYLKSLRGLPPPVAVTDHPCRRCGYNLKGLPLGGVCPECGTPFKPAAAGRFHDSLTDAPLEYLRTLRSGLHTLAGALAVLVVGPGAAFFVGPYAVAGAALLVGVLWMAGVWVLVTPRPALDAFTPDPLLDSRPLTQACRTLHAAPALAGFLAGAAIATLTTPPLSTTTLVLLWAEGGMYVVSALALVPLGVYLSALTDWAGHDTLGAQFRVAVFMLVAATLMAVGAGMGAVVSPGFRAGLAGVVILWAGIIVAAAALFFLFLLVRLAGSARWAMLNAVSAMATEARVAERRARDAVRLTEAQRTAVPTREGHGGSWRDSGFLTIDGDEIDPTASPPH